MKIIILGHRGMLGQMAARYFAKAGYDVVTIDERFDFTATCPALNRLSTLGDGLVLNCIARIKQKDSDRQGLFDANAVFPLQLYERLGAGQFLVQPSTDGVFSGSRKTGAYGVDDPCDAADDYGFSKRLGEVALLYKPRAVILRVSIIGLDWIDPQPKGLLGWFLSQEKSSQLNGYANHLWNGITTYELCRQVAKLASKPDLTAGSVVQLGNKEIVSKYDTLMLFQEVFETDFKIYKCHAADTINRALIPDVICPPLRQQLIEMKEFCET